jgi:hypothetical protein
MAGGNGGRAARPARGSGSGPAGGRAPRRPVSAREPGPAQQALADRLAAGGDTLGAMSDETQAEKDARVARAFAAASLAREDVGPRADHGPADVVEGYAMELLDHLDGSVPRALSAARAACLSAAGEVAHPGRWRTAMLAVELCRRAAHLAGHDGGDPDDPGPAAPGHQDAARQDAPR